MENNMPVNDIISQALDNNPLKVKQAFDDEMTSRVRAALNTKYQDMTAEHPEVAEVETMNLAAEPEAEAGIDGIVADEVDVRTGQTVESHMTLGGLRDE
jgi:2-oxo-4-hydroxy-4-carboxy--5-ureidoimidazoline (OHCU) decarboxylase